MGGVLDPLFSMRREGGYVGDLAGLEKYVDFMVKQDADFLVMLPTCAINPNDPCPYVGMGFFTNNAIAHLPLDEMIEPAILREYEADFIKETASAIASGKPLPHYFSRIFIDKLKDVSGEDLEKAIADYLKAEFAAARSGDLIRWPLVMAFNEYCLRKYFFGNVYDEKQNGLKEGDAGFKEFVRKNKKWVNGYGIEEYALFHSLFNYRQTSGDDLSNAWWEWGALINPNSTVPEHQTALAAAKEANKQDIIFYEYLQWRYLERYKKTKAYYVQRNKRIIGDLDMYPAGNSATMWALQKLYNRHKSNGAPAGPEAPLGQNWYSPALNWDTEFDLIMELWVARIIYMAQFCDGLRIDHVLGLIQEWVIPEGGKPQDGGWNLPLDQALRRGEIILRRLAKVAQDNGVLLICEDIGERETPVKKLLAQLSLELPNVLLYNPVGWRNRQMDEEAAGYGRRPRYMVVEATHDMPPTIPERLKGELNELNNSRDNFLAWLDIHGIHLPVGYREWLRGEHFREAEEKTVVAMKEEGYYCFTMQTLLGNGFQINVPGVPWIERPENWSWMHAPVESLAALPNLGFFDIRAEAISAADRQKAGLLLDDAVLSSI